MKLDFQINLILKGEIKKNNEKKRFKLNLVNLPHPLLGHDIRIII
jgi:hypothetical protein